MRSMTGGVGTPGGEGMEISPSSPLMLATVPAKSAFNASLQIEGDNKPGTLSAISAQISSLNVSIQSISGKPMPDDRYIIEMTFEVSNTDQLNVIIRNLKKLKCVSDVYRMNR